MSKESWAQWEYDIVRSRNVPLSVTLDELGSFGWELVAAYYDADHSGDHILYFKRPKD